ncbi:MAG TPA: hypothetical protein VD907_07115 [Verrucomicrobiae bacterium]|nr:hypothetical protein [Verrucomicrobiae bacterium]
MTIKAGFGGKPTTIKLSYRATDTRNAELWIEQEGLKQEGQRYETLAYISLDELLDLQAEIKKTIARIVA